MTGFVNDLLGSLPPLLVLTVVAALVAAETAVLAGMVLPAASALITLGLLANAGLVPIGPALAVGVGAALLGGTLAFHAGRQHGTRVPAEAVSVGAGRSRAKAWERASRLFDRFGGRAIFLGQWVVGARTLAPRLAGSRGVSYLRFAAWHTPAATLWAGWMVGASYLAGASYNMLAARAGRAGGALAVLSVLLVVLILIGRWLGRHPDPVRGVTRIPWLRARAGRTQRFQLRHPAGRLALGTALLAVLAAVLLIVVPSAVRFSGLAEADTAVADWAESQWTSDGYYFAVTTVTWANPAALMVLAAAVCLARWWWLRRRGRGIDLLTALGPVIPMALLAWCTAPLTEWRAPEKVSFPAAEEYSGSIPFDAAAGMATVAAGHTAQLTAAVGLLVWLVARRLPWKLRITAWTAAAAGVVVCAGSWVYLGWSRTSETVAALMIGMAWAALNAAVWSTRTDAGSPARVRVESASV